MFSEIIQTISSYVMGTGLVVLCLLTGLYFSIRTGFLQVRFFKKMCLLLFKNKHSRQGISSFQSLALSLAGRIGTGNIAGVATAIAFGGPGAVFWMWIVAFLGASTSYVECSLGQIYKEKINGHFRGGPAFYIEKGLNAKWYAMIFAVVCILAEGIFCPGVQSNAVGYAFEKAFNIDIRITALVVAFILALVIFGGIKRIAKFAEIVTPFMALCYVIVAMIVIIANIKQVPHVFSIIIDSAFGLNPALGGMVGSAISMGVKRGIYSNEAGQGSAVHAAAAADVKHPAEQGLVQAFSVYIDTLFVCSCTAFIILSTGMYDVFDNAKNVVFSGGSLPSDIIDNGPIYTQLGVDSVLNKFGVPFIAVALAFFAFTTLVSYYFQAETNVYYIFKNSKRAKIVINILRVLFLISMFYTSVSSMQFAWDFGDIGVGLMAWVNIIAIIALQKPALKIFNDYQKQRKKGIENPVYNSEKLKIRNGYDFKD